MTLPNITCYWIEPAGKINRYLRRYTSGVACPNKANRFGYHQTLVMVATLPSTNNFKCPNRNRTSMHPDYPHDDARWPTTCVHCDYVFVPSDAWQVCSEDIYVCPATGVEKEIDDWEPGAVFDAWWHKSEPYKGTAAESWVGADGISVSIRLPGRNDWHLDVPTSSGTPWQRTGDPRNPASLSASPSILCTGSPRYHGWLTNGVITTLADSEPW